MFTKQISVVFLLLASALITSALPTPSRAILERQDDDTKEKGTGVVGAVKGIMSNPNTMKNVGLGALALAAVAAGPVAAVIDGMGEGAAMVGEGANTAANVVKEVVPDVTNDATEIGGGATKVAEVTGKVTNDAADTAKVTNEIPLASSDAPQVTNDAAEGEANKAAEVTSNPAENANEPAAVTSNTAEGATDAADAAAIAAKTSELAGQTFSTNFGIFNGLGEPHEIDFKLSGLSKAQLRMRFEGEYRGIFETAAQHADQGVGELVEFENGAPIWSQDDLAKSPWFRLDRLAFTFDKIGFGNQFVEFLRHVGV